MKILARAFYSRDPAIVAKELLGKCLVRKIGKKELIGKIVETEAYYGPEDPASRAYKGKVTKISRWMWEAPGTTLVYMVHANWLFNIVTGKAGEPSAVLIRAIEPINFKADTAGPGKFTRAMKITGAHSGLNVADPKSEIVVTEGAKERFQICRSHRVGVTRDLPRKLRFFIKGSKFVSK